MPEPRASRETTIERDLVTWAEQNGWLVRKLTGKRGDPDRMFLRGGFVVFMELKRPGNEARKLQRFVHNKYMAAGHPVHIVDNVEQGQRILQRVFP
ncbi:MAG: VRR-NUC domain-containing protein [Pseudomonadota bacterium]